MKALAILLIAVGLVGLLYGGVTWARTEKVVDLGPVQINHEERKSLPVPPIIGGLCLVGGIALLVSTSRRARSA